MSHSAIHAGLYDLCREPRRINYDLMAREYPKLKAALTRAENSKDPEKVLAACERFVKVSDEVGCMPDDWHRWRIALEDAFAAFRRSDGWELSAIPGGIVDRFQRLALSFA